MDITTSMNPYLVQVQQNLLNIINKIILECPGIDLNIGFIGFRDVTHTESYVNLEFTQNHEELKNSINNVYTSKGDDGNEEDIEEGIEMALKKDWKSNARFAILVTDFPCHGIKYSLNTHDIYPNGNPNRRNIEVLINELAEHQISLFCIKVTSYTDKMFEIFNTIYNSYEKCKFKVIPLKSETNFTQVVVESSADIYMNQRNIN